jgi:hypothetical protein
VKTICRAFLEHFNHEESRVLNRIRNTIRKARQILSGYDAALARITALEAELRKRTTVACDIGYRPDANYAILIGSHRGRDYVQTFAIEAESFPGLVSRLRDLQRVGQVRHVDCPPQMSAVVEREIKL